MSLVLDSSMAISWLLEDEWTEPSLAVLNLVIEEGAVVPSIWRLEIANVLRTAVKRGRCDEAFADRSLRRLSSFSIELDEQTNAQAWGATLTLSRMHGLTLYDACYLELAIRLSLPLATGDRELIAAAQRLGVPVLATRPA